MLRHRHIVLLQKLVDNELTPPERRKTDKLLDEDPEAREFLDSLRKAIDAVRSLPEVEPPPALRQHVMNLVAAAERKAPVQEMSLAARIRQMFVQPHPAPRSALAAGIVIGMMMSVVGYGLFVDADVSGDDVAGTIGGSAAVKSWLLHDSVLIGGPGHHGSAMLFSRPDELLVELDVATDRPLRIEVMNVQEPATQGQEALPAVVQVDRDGPTHVSITRPRATWTGHAVVVRVMDGAIVLSEHRLRLKSEKSSDSL